ncbi:MAG TPA: YkgJ family cysteine cluster protein [Tepidisphaeraceae bacterium]|jgi:Fe-S-cluster containining protein|nr:YkgJ family cysteine cluster protein [Tepidisphaeraceae bacterium]
MSSLCDQCAALCCRYISLPIDNPETRKDYDDIRWYLIHQNIVVYIEKAQWYVGVLNRCKHLQDDNRCGIYETRPAICRKYTTDNCDYHGGEYDFEQLFTSAEHLMEYAETALEEARAKKVNQRRRAQRQKLPKSTRPNVLPVVRAPVALTVKGRRPLPLVK